MKFSQYAGIAIIPTLSRLVLALAFITVGFNKLTTDATFTAEQAEALQEVGVTARSTTAAGLRSIVPTRNPQGEETGQPPAGEAAAGPPQPGPAGEGDQIVNRLAEGQYTARKLYTVALSCQEAGWGKYSFYLAWAAALAEFAGGILILVGFLSRIWGLGLAIVMGTAIYLTTWSAYFITTGPFAAAQGGDGSLLFNQTFTQLGLGLLALGIFLTGPGPLSLDRLVFGKRGGQAGAGETAEASPVVSAMMSSSAARAGGSPERKPQPAPEQGGRSSSERPL